MKIEIRVNGIAVVGPMSLTSATMLKLNTGDVVTLHAVREPGDNTRYKVIKDRSAIALHQLRVNT